MKWSLAVIILLAGRNYTMNSSLKSLFLLLFGVFIALKCGNEGEFKDRYDIKFTNNSLYTISDINLSMTGAEETITFKSLLRGQSSEYQAFFLPKISKESMPISWGDYSGIYTLQDSVKTIYIFSADHRFNNEVIIEIGNNNYEVKYPSSDRVK